MLAKDLFVTDLAVIGHDDIVAAAVRGRCRINNWGNRAVSTASTILRLRRGQEALAILHQYILVSLEM
ncbi:MAG: hypothetical protein QOD88_2009, partial [Mycobacterium sp.]|nr:hypothetical protein [Mycobacterium sp.]